MALTHNEKREIEVMADEFFDDLIDVIADRASDAMGVVSSGKEGEAMDYFTKILGNRIKSGSV